MPSFQCKVHSLMEYIVDIMRYLSRNITLNTRMTWMVKCKWCNCRQIHKKDLFKNFLKKVFFSKGSCTDPSNYRPISLTCIGCKAFEHIIVSSISEHVKSYNIICTEQHEFRKQHSCQTQLLKTINDLSASLNSGNQIDLLLLDFSKAFDIVSHPHLLHKLSTHGIRGPLLNWISDFLNDRQQQVLLQNERSWSSSVMSGVPQGSVILPSLHKLHTL